MMTDINSGKPWSERNIHDLQECLRLGTPIDEIAAFLCRDVEEVRAKIAEFEPVSAEVFAWDRRVPAVDYTFANGNREAHPIGLEDWPILLRLERAGKLTFQNDDIRQRFQWMKPSSDDPS